MRVLLWFVLAAVVVGCLSCSHNNASATHTCPTDASVAMETPGSIFPKGEHEDYREFQLRVNAQMNSTTTILPKGEHEDFREFQLRVNAQMNIRK